MPSSPHKAAPVSLLRSSKEQIAQKMSLDSFEPRLPPYNNEVEQALLAALLHNNSVYDKVSEFLLSDHFANGAHQIIYHAISKLIERREPADPLTLKNFFSQQDTLSEIGGIQYLAQLAGSLLHYKC